MDKIDPDDLDAAADPKRLGAYLSLLSAGHEEHLGHGGMAEVVREDDYKGHRILVRTSYRFEVDGRAVAVPIMLDDDGNVHCHSLPNYQFKSATALVRELIDTFPDDFPPPTGGAADGGKGPSEGGGAGKGA